jgi:hypothetical protein
MKRSTLVLSAALLAVAGGWGWVLIENGRLRSELVLAESAKAPLVRTRQAIGSDPLPGAPKNPEATADDSSTPAKKIVSPGRSAARPAGAVSAGSLRVVDNGDGTFTVSDPAGSWQRVFSADQLREFRQSMDATMQASVTKLPGGPSWSPGRAAGPPDTPEHGDYATAWASQSPDAGKEWLQLKYPKSVEISEINVHETYNPGALSKVSAIMPDGSERVIWEGTEDPEAGVVERAVKVPPGIHADQIRIELDTSRVPGWNEIDAVELVGRDGSRQWAAESTASSYYGQGRDAGMLVSEDIHSFGPRRASPGNPTAMPEPPARGR